MSNSKPIVNVAGKLKELPSADHLLLQQALALPIIATPATPGAGIVLVYAKSDKNAYQLDELGVESLLPGGGGGGGGITIISVSSTPYNLAPTSNRYLLLIDASAGAVVINLPTAVGNTAEFIFKKIDSTLNTVTIEGLAAETIDTELNKTILFQNTSFSIISDNANWQRLT